MDKSPPGRRRPALSQDPRPLRPRVLLAHDHAPGSRGVVAVTGLALPLIKLGTLGFRKHPKGILAYLERADGGHPQPPALLRAIAS